MCGKGAIQLSAIAPPWVQIGTPYRRSMYALPACCGAENSPIRSPTNCMIATKIGEGGAGKRERFVMLN